MRVYTPVAAGGDPLPVLVYFHGGGFVIGDLETHDGLCRLFANEGGFRVIAVDYRLAPEHKFPAALDDAFAAVAWIEAHAAELGVDANRIAVGGDCAGGALAAEVAQHAKAKGAPKIAFQLLLFPVTQIGDETGIAARIRRSAISSTSRRSTGSSAITSRPGTDKIRSAGLAADAPDFKGLPPAYVMLGGFDPLHDEGLAYARQAARRGREGRGRGLFRSRALLHLHAGACCRRRTRR